MIDEIETKLLKGCREMKIPNKYIRCGVPNERKDGEILYCPACQTKLEQHRATKKWIKGLIQHEFVEFRIENSNADFKTLITNCNKLEIDILKQISGESK